MRPIKFRAWSGERFYYWGFINGVFISPIYKDDAIVLENQQYTGLKDKNGKEIYEGDVVNIETDYEAFDNIVVEWNYEQLTRLSYDVKGTEVIGNIYENKDLIAD
jgi:hypothetical protein